jgi:hypothetical protein
MQTFVECLVLIVEDELLVALDIADTFKNAGAQVIISRTLGDAMHQAETENLTAASRSSSTAGSASLRGLARTGN